MTADTDPLEPPQNDAWNGPYLILESSKTYPLSNPVTNIGRREGNDLVVSDPRVSRDHAQIRIIHGECVLFDLNSTGGTFVNGHRINTHSLRPGDVIAIAGVSLIFGQDTPAAPRSTGTSPAQLNPERSNLMSGIVVLILRIFLATALYAFLGWALYTLWRELRMQTLMLAAQKTPTLTLTRIGMDEYEPAIFQKSEIFIGRESDLDLPHHR